MTFAVEVRLAVLGEMLSMTVESMVLISGFAGLVSTTTDTAMPMMVSMSILVVVSMLVGVEMPMTVSMSI
jgi:hypothetical protein